MCPLAQRAGRARHPKRSVARRMPPHNSVPSRLTAVRRLSESADLYSFGMQSICRFHEVRSAVWDLFDVGTRLDVMRT
jgi:hypothetical protein